MGELIVKPENKRISLEKGETLLSHLQSLGVNINAYCGGKGECGACLVKVEHGMEYLSLITDLEKRFVKKPGYRLACQAKTLREDVEIYVEIPRYAKYKILERGRKKTIPPNEP